MNQQEQQNIEKIIQYIKDETQKKINTIQKETKKEAELEKVIVLKPEKEKIKKKNR